MNGLSYKAIYALRDAFRKSGARYGDDFNKYDTPATLYFRPFFYFIKEQDYGGNLLDVLSYNKELTTTHSAVNNKKAESQYLYNADKEKPFVNTAYNYLLVNCEYERAEYLKEFVQLLSNISTYSPWYFKQIDGLGDALKHTEFKAEDFEIAEERKKITFTMLPDAYDQRVGTLLDLYRSACYSFTMNKEIVPANLRKFDMGILLFNTPIQNMHRYNTGNVEDTDSFAKFGLNRHQIDNIPGYFTNTKYIEFQNCEIEINSSGLDSVNNEDGIRPEYKIEISFDKCYETRYNEIIPQIITDIIDWDTKSERANASDISVYGIDGTVDPSISFVNETEVRSNMYDSNILTGAINQMTSMASSAIGNITDSIVLGNLFDVISLSKIGDTAQSLASGNVMGAANQIKGMAENGNGISVAGVGVRTSSGWLKKNIENPDNLNQNGGSKRYSLNPNQYIQMGKDGINKVIRTKVSKK